MQVIRRLIAAVRILEKTPVALASAMVASLATMLVVWPTLALAQSQQDVVGAPKPWEMGMQRAYGPIKAHIVWLDNLVLVIITIITLFVAGLLAWVIWRYNAKRNPVPSRTSHNTVIEVLWTVIPVVILVIIAIPSFQLIYYEDRTPDPDLTVKVTGHQWYWEYTYQDKNNIDFSSYIVPDNELKPGQLRLLTVDNDLVIPVGKNIRILTTSADVIHSFFVPALGTQRYAIPGRLIETWMRADKPGIFYGECNQICGTNHSRMPIVVHAVPEKEFQAWLTMAKTKFAAADKPGFAETAGAARSAQQEPTRVAAAAQVTTVSVER